MGIQANSHITDSQGQGKFVCHKQSPTYTYTKLSPSYAVVYIMSLGNPFYLSRNQLQIKIKVWYR